VAGIEQVEKEGYEELFCVLCCHQIGDGVSDAFLRNIPSQDGIKQGVYKVHRSFSLFEVVEVDASQHEQHD